MFFIYLKDAEGVETLMFSLDLKWNVQFLLPLFIFFPIFLFIYLIILWTLFFFFIYFY